RRLAHAPDRAAGARVLAGDPVPGVVDLGQRRLAIRARRGPASDRRGRRAHPRRATRQPPPAPRRPRARRRGDRRVSGGGRRLSEQPLYCPFFCEENVWHLCAHPRGAAAGRRVVSIASPDRRVAMWGQKASREPRAAIAWDYHVVLLLRELGRAWQVWDLD